VVIISLAATIAVVSAIVLVQRGSGAGWTALLHVFRGQEDHPHWELLAQ
jgi:hypothetical protein